MLSEILIASILLVLVITLAALYDLRRSVLTSQYVSRRYRQYACGLAPLRWRVFFNLFRRMP